ncbi:putative leucine-rich repeat domain superfamily [Helianthus annuus]|nr:putative leucine-rich repeat domain superfamily [Helianthus annuus]
MLTTSCHSLPLRIIMLRQPSHPTHPRPSRLRRHSPASHFSTHPTHHHRPFRQPLPRTHSKLPLSSSIISKHSSSAPTHFLASSHQQSQTSKNLQTLDMSHNSFTGSLPNSLTQLTQLTRLDLSFNKLTGPIPKLPKNLIQLALKSNSLSGYLTKQSFTESTQLEVIELSDNSLTEQFPAGFLTPSTQQINLANNSFTGLVILKPVNSTLVAVNLGFNKLYGYLPATFPAYSMLASLSLSYNKLRGRIPSEYSKISRLFLEGNLLIGLPPKELFSRKISITGSLGDNCLKSCPVWSELCVKSQKPFSICQKAYQGKVKQ